jgi:Leucine Rich repeat
MDSRNIAIIAACSTVFTCALLLTASGCGSKLPAAQADAVSKLEAAGAIVKSSKDGGKVTFVDFFAVQDVPGTIVHIKVLPDVETLNFNGPNTGDDELAHLAGLSGLKVLALANTNITDKGLAHVAGLSKLEKLTLNNCNVSDEGLVHLQNLKQLKQLHLNETKVTDAGLEHLVGLEQLEALMVYGTEVTPAAAAVFREKRPETMVVTSEGESGADDE